MLFWVKLKFLFCDDFDFGKEIIIVGSPVILNWFKFSDFQN